MSRELDFQVHDDPLFLYVRDVRISILLTEKVIEYKSVQDTNYFFSDCASLSYQLFVWMAKNEFYLIFFFFF